MISLQCHPEPVEGILVPVGSYERDPALLTIVVSAYTQKLKRRPNRKKTGTKKSRPLRRMTLGFGQKKSLRYLHYFSRGSRVIDHRCWFLLFATGKPGSKIFVNFLCTNKAFLTGLLHRLVKV